MATSTRVISGFAEAMGIQPSAVIRMLVPMRPAGLVPIGEKGRGKERGHYHSPDLANLILAMGAEHHNGTADAVSALRPLVFQSGFERDSPGDPDRPPVFAGSFGQALERMLEQAASCGHEHLPARIEFCLNSLRANIKWGPFDNYEVPKRADYYRSDTVKRAAPHHERVVIIHSPALLQVSDLLRDTLQHPASPSSSGPASPASDGPGNENAAPARAAPRRPRKSSADGFLDRRQPTPMAFEGQQLARGRDPANCTGMRRHDHTAYSTLT